MKCYREKLYDFLLIDFSLIQFRYGPTSNAVSFAYLEAPVESIPYQDYLVNEIGFQDEELEEVGDLFRNDYELAMQDRQFKSTFTPIRYDYEPESYTQSRHPAAHVHFGFGNDIRVCTMKQLRPISFLFFVLRQCYPNSWLEFGSHSTTPTLVRQVRDALEDVAAEYLQERDHWEMILR